MTTTSAHIAPESAPLPQPSIGELAKDVSTHLSTLIHGEIELAKSEVTASVKNAGTGAGMFIAAAVVAAFSLTFGLIALAEGLIALGLWRWLGYLIVFLLLVLIAAALVFLGIKKVKKVKAPQRTIATTKDTVAFLKHPTTVS
ncbi:MAG: uncharacterized protein JWN20_2355 [Jatrophihabitantaceae bacterium]|nr:uncharacterized protein [Jatrophihabitantaceae bacterium]